MDESDDFHLALALGASQRVDVVDFLDPQIQLASAQYFEVGGFGSAGLSSSRGVVFFSFLAECEPRVLAANTP